MIVCLCGTIDLTAIYKELRKVYLHWLLSWISWHNLVLGHFLPLSLLAWCMRIGLHVVGVFSR